MINMRNIKIDTISKTITFEKSVTPSEIKHLIESLHNYNIVIQEPNKEEVKSEKEILEILKDKSEKDKSEPHVFYPWSTPPYIPIKSDIPDFEPPFNPTCTSPCFCSGKCKTGWSANKSSKFPWNLQDQ